MNKALEAPIRAGTVTGEHASGTGEHAFGTGYALVGLCSGTGQTLVRYRVHSSGVQGMP